MKGKLLLGLSIVALLLPLCLPVSAAEDTVLIEPGSEWAFSVTDNDGFDAMRSDWMTSDFDPDWQIGTAPFGDRLEPSQAEKYGWMGENYGIFLRHTFKLRSATVMENMHFYLRIYYDNSIHVYLNGTKIFVHDDGGSGDWVDDYVLIELDDVSSLLKKGANILAVSVHDNAGGREFDLSLFATVEPIEDETVAKPDDWSPPADPDTDNEPDGTMAPEDFGSGLPFTNSPVETSSSIVTVYVTAEPVAATSAPKVSYTAPLTMVGSALAIAVLMVVTALLISRRNGKSGGNP